MKQILPSLLAMKSRFALVELLITTPFIARLKNNEDKLEWIF